MKSQNIKKAKGLCVCRHSFDEHLANREHPCMVIMRYSGIATVCACTSFTPTKAKHKIIMRQTIEGRNNG